jgi:hypothetical protein
MGDDFIISSNYLQIINPNQNNQNNDQNHNNLSTIRDNFDEYLEGRKSNR